MHISHVSLLYGHYFAYIIKTEEFVCLFLVNTCISGTTKLLKHNGAIEIIFLLDDAFIVEG